MPWRLILFIVIFAVFLTFVTLNLDNRCGVNFGFAQFEEVPIFLTVFISFALGLLCAMPLALRLGRKKKGAPRRIKEQNDDLDLHSSADPEIDEKIKQDAVAAKERFFANRRGKKK